MGNLFCKSGYSSTEFIAQPSKTNKQNFLKYCENVEIDNLSTFLENNKSKINLQPLLTPTKFNKNKIPPLHFASIASLGDNNKDLVRKSNQAIALLLDYGANPNTIHHIDVPYAQHLLDRYYRNNKKSHIKIMAIYGVEYTSDWLVNRPHYEEYDTIVDTWWKKSETIWEKENELRGYAPIKKATAHIAIAEIWLSILKHEINTKDFKKPEFAEHYFKKVCQACEKTANNVTEAIAKNETTEDYQTVLNNIETILKELKKLQKNVNKLNKTDKLTEYDDVHNNALDLANNAFKNSNEQLELNKSEEKSEEESDSSSYTSSCPS